MSLDDFEDEDLVVRNARTGDAFLRFGSKLAKDNFLKVMENMVTTQERNKSEGYKCGNCAAYPCFRTMFSQTFLEKGPFIENLFSKNPSELSRYERIAKEEALRPAGLCFQHVRKCRPECKFYLQETEGIPVEDLFKNKITGICKKDNLGVAYGQECHISEMKKSKL